MKYDWDESPDKIYVSDGLGGHAHASPHMRTLIAMTNPRNLDRMDKEERAKRKQAHKGTSGRKKSSPGAQRP